MANPIILDVNNSSSHELAIFSDYINGIANDHCPVMPTVYQYPYNWDPIYFDLVDNDIVKSDIWLPTPPIVPAPPKATMAEVHLLKDYGKVMYYKIEFSLGDPANYSDVAYVLSLEDISGSAIPINVTDVFGGDLYYHPGFEELVVDVNSPTFNIPFVRAHAPISTSIGDFKAITSADDIKSFVTLKVERN